MTHLEVLQFEQGRWEHAGLRERAIGERFGVSVIRYHQVLNQVIDDPESERLDPMTVRRLRRLRERTAANRLRRR